MHWNTIWRSLVILVALCLSPALARGRTLLVDASGGGDYLLVSEAVAAASSGDTVAIRPGTYDEYDGTDYHIQRDSIAIHILGLGAPQDVRLRLSIMLIDCTAVLQNLTFHDEHTPMYAGGPSSSLVVRMCVFQDNTHFLSGGAVAAHGLSAEFEDCTFADNTVDYADRDGGAVYVSGASCVVRRCTFVENSCTRSGGAIYTSANYASIQDCIFIGNVAHNGAAITAGVPGIRHCSFWRNRTTWESGAALEILGPDADILTSIIAGTINGYGIGCWGPGVTYCCCYWENERGPSAAECEPLPQDGNIEANPLFCDPANDDLWLRDDSPCLPGEHSGWTCDMMGAFGVGCGDTPTESTSWGRIKDRFLHRE